MHPELPSDRRYSTDHLWLDHTGRVGVTRYLALRLPEITAAHLPEVGAEILAAGELGALEGDKGLVDLYAPCDGVVLSVNDAVTRDPTIIGRAPYDAWLVSLRVQAVHLLTADEYRAHLRRTGAPVIRRIKREGES